MKNYILSALFCFAFCILFASCKKDYTCTCKDGSGTVIATVTYDNVKKDDAESACNASASTGFVTVTCTLEEN